MKKYFTLFTALLLTISVFAQKKKDILLEIDNKPVYVNEFKRVYSKNLDLVQQESQRDIDGYLELFIDYKLKIAEAKNQKLDEKSEYLSEFEKYRNQLSRNFLAEDQLVSELAKEAFERGKEEIDASHILIRVGYEALPKDTLEAYNKIKAVREKALKGEDFAVLAQKNSEEPNAKETKGHLGYFTVMQMVYPFETEAYNTKVGEISNIVRSSFGYHIIKVHDRRERAPKIAVSHIMISDKQGARNFNPKERIEEILAMYKQGSSFEELAKEYSDDLATGRLGGALKAFRKGELRSDEFEEAAYGLKNAGDVSEPVQSAFGWHIIRLDEILAPESFEDQKEELEKKIATGDRAKSIVTTINKDIKKKYGFKNGSDYHAFFNTYVTDSILHRKWKRTPIATSDNKTLFKIGDKEVKFSDFAEYIESNQKTIRPTTDKEVLLANFYNDFETETLREYFKNRLEKENEDYAAVLNEYREGLLIFDVMEHNIWEKAKTDSIGIQNFYEKSKQNYRWKKRVSGDVFSTTSQIMAERVQTMLKGGKEAEEIKSELNAHGEINVMLTQGNFEIDQNILPENLELKEGVSSVYPRNGSFIVVNIQEILPEGIKDLDDVRGTVVSQYQNQVEKDWMESLHSKYQVKINEKTLKRLKKELK